MLYYGYVLFVIDLFMEAIKALLASYEYWGNTYWSYVVALVIFVGSLIVLKLFQTIILARVRALSKKTKTDIDDAFIDAISKISKLFYIALSAYAGSLYLNLSETLDYWFRFFVLAVILYEAIRAAEHLISFGIRKYLNRTKKEGESDQGSEAMVRIGVLMVRLLLWGVGILMILSNLGINITSLVASLGIGGIAIALAVQNILSDIFSSFSLYIDKPFQVGDYIVVGEHSGTVKKIGMKTTRLQALRGEEIVVSNKELTTARVQNFKKLEKRREVLMFGVVYETDAKKLEKIPSIVEQIISSVEHVEFGRCHFSVYNTSSLDFETVYFVDTADYDLYMDAKQKINLGLLKEFKKEKIDFAYPTQTVVVKK